MVVEPLARASPKAGSADQAEGPTDRSEPNSGDSHKGLLVIQQTCDGSPPLLAAAGEH